jgi:selenide,water dikinase
LPASTDANVLVGAATSDDAAVYRLTPELALVQTVDYITPLVDDPYQFGQIAAANSLSDVYAMGGRPLIALNVVAFPTDTLPIDVLGEILRGGADKVRESGAQILGGHSIDDREPKYGLAVTGLVHPDRVLRNSTARAGDRLVLTKPLGMGIVSTAVKRDLASDELIRNAVAVMSALNDRAASAAAQVGVDAGTDITGFGLLGHLREMTEASGVGARLSFAAVPVLDGVAELAENDVLPGGTRRNLAYVADVTTFAAAVTPVRQSLLADAQTSGGLLFAVPAARSADLLDALRRSGVPAATDIGEIVDGAGITVSA